MPGQSHAYELLKKFLQISTASLPVETRLEQILHSISEAFQPDRCFLVKAEQIGSGGLFSAVTSGRKALWVVDAASLDKEHVLPEEEHFLVICAAAGVQAAVWPEARPNKVVLDSDGVWGRDLTASCP